MKQKIGMTEVIQDSLNPEYVQAIEVDYFFEESHQFILEVFDVDDATQVNNLSKQQFVGSLQFTLH